MHNTSQIFVLLLNIYFNLGVINPCFHRNELPKLSNVTSDFFGITLSLNESPEIKLEKLMHDYVNKLIDIKDIDDKEIAIAAMQAARKSFMQRATEIEPQLKAWMNDLTEKEVVQFKENLMLKPYFKNINDLVLSYKLSNKFENNPEFINTLDGMGDFLTILYN